MNKTKRVIRGILLPGLTLSVLLIGCENDTRVLAPDIQSVSLEKNVGHKSNRALQFDGVDDYVDLPESSSLTNFTNQITIEAWIYSDNFQNASIIASGNQNDYALASQPDGRLRVDMYAIDVSGVGAFFSRTSLLTHRWYHVAVVYDGSHQTIFIDGSADTSRPASGNLSTSPQSEDVRIGSYSGAGPNFFRGIIDEVRIWNVARTRAQIRSRMNTELTGGEAGLMGYWKLNGNVLDTSPNGNNGSIFGDPVFVAR